MDIFTLALIIGVGLVWATPAFAEAVYIVCTITKFIDNGAETPDRKPVVDRYEIDAAGVLWFGDEKVDGRVTITPQHIGVVDVRNNGAVRRQRL